jgi:hypothetical protein
MRPAFMVLMLTVDLVQSRPGTFTAAVTAPSSPPQPRGRPEGNDFLRANQTLRWVDITQAEKMYDGTRKPFGIFEQKQSNDYSQSEKQAQSDQG